jgi:hypothetical protein
MAAEPSPLDLAREARLTRDLVLADRAGARVEDLRDCAKTLAKSGSAGAADLLFDVADLALGAASDDLRVCGSRDRGGSTWDVAAEELSDLISAAEGAPDLLENEDSVRLELADADGGPEESSQAPVAPPDREWLSNAFGPALKGLLEPRTRRTPLAVPGPGATRSSGPIDDAFRKGPFDLTTLRREPSELATALAFNVARRVLIGRSELARSPYGDPALFAAAERLTARGLGLGFRNIGLLAPTWSEIGVLITEAGRRRPREHAPESTVARFGVLLTIGLPAAGLRGLVDELADDGETRILEGILVRLLREPWDLVDLEALRAVRDAFLDLGDPLRAVAAQKRLTLVTAWNPAELVAQNELKASWRQATSPDSAASQGRSEGPAPRAMRRSGFASSAPQRLRRFEQARERRAADQL